MKLKLYILERMVLLHILPKEGDFLTLKHLRELKEELLINDEEKKAYNITESKEGGYAWDKSKDLGKEFVLTEFQLDLTKKCLRDLEEKHKLTDELFTVYDKIINGGV